MISNPKHVRRSKFNGVVPQPNGLWGSYIYIHACNGTVWLGTFKSESEAARAFDSAAIKLRFYDHHRNFAWTSLSNDEVEFQKYFTFADIVKMIMNGSYTYKFDQFLNMKKHASDQIRQNPFSLPHILLFQKILTQSDVEQRLGIPKKHAIEYFPNIDDHDNANDTYVEFFDRDKKPWRFRYSRWKSSYTFVFTRGWREFVGVKQLKPKDVVSFYACDSLGRRVFMIDHIKTQNYEGVEDQANQIETQNYLEQAGPSAQPGGQRIKEEPVEFDQEEKVKKTIRLFGKVIDIVVIDD